jgi:hypothetical protein
MLASVASVCCLSGLKLVFMIFFYGTGKSHAYQQLLRRTLVLLAGLRVCQWLQK